MQVMNPTIKVFSVANGNLSADEFLPLAVPIGCNLYLLKNVGPDNLYMRSNPQDAAAEDYLTPGASESLASPGRPSNISRSDRYAQGDVLYFVKGTGPLIAKFWL